MKIRIAAVSAATLVALLGSVGPAAAATSTSYGSPAQHAAVAQLAGADDGDPAAPGAGNDQAPAGQQPAVQQPGTGQQQPAAPTQLNNVQTQAGGGAIAVGSVAVLLLGTVSFFLVKRGGLKAAHLALGVAMGVLLAGTFIGPLVQQVTGSAVTSFGAILGGL
ncbi:hypothetical protein [Streptomyces marispadix]|uniref:Integral membrane protein n=1 Tax=Streptomyces marispadix TaxID=2922868 RepID=A0ABS9T0G9_9ACTN|nr:hypothetical protein [Streptomyces marispadix]MCH6162025.1 hypothetical protein [Streptomyces marispadix]